MERVNNSDTEVPLSAVDILIRSVLQSPRPRAVVNARLWLLLMEYC